ncbi:MAG: hypothetical protein Q8M92_04780 [Candidatus Subteraquimicrobiales bacterium]|nr:hypothetical protein [Candidatus Subteraquimicrobiales bacterium]
MRYRPNETQLQDMIGAGMSLRRIAEICGYSVSSVARFCEEQGVKKPPMGRKKGFKTTEETRKRMSEAIRAVRGLE